MDFDDLREYEPFEWPGRQIVEQDNMGDWGSWLENHLGDRLQDALVDPEDDFASLAEEMAGEYIAAC